MSLLFHNALIRLRGIRFRQRSTDSVQADLLTRIDVCWAANCGLSVTDCIRGADFNARGLLLSLRAGEPYRIARALAFQAVHVSADGSRSRRRTTKLVQAADAVARQVSHPHALAMVAMARGLTAFMEGLWDAAISNCDHASEIFRDRCTGVAWELNTVNIIALWSLAYTGRLVELARRRALLLREARERGDLHAEITLTSVSLARIAQDDPDGLLAELARPCRDGLTLVFTFSIIIACRLQSMFISIKETGLLRGATSTRSGPHTLARSFLCFNWPVSTLSSRNRGSLSRLRRAPLTLVRWNASLSAGARRLEKENVAWATAMARLVRAGVAGVRGERPRAAALLAEAAQAFDAVEMPLYAASARRRLGEILGGDEGAAMVAGADTLMTGRGVREPARLAAMYAPGFAGSE